MTFDIANHSWSGNCVLSARKIDNERILLEVGEPLNEGRWIPAFINKHDATAIAKHFHDLMSDDEKIEFWDTMYEGYKRQYGDAPQSETTGKLKSGESVSVKFHNGIEWIKAPKDLSVTWQQDD